jgi:hypothetical protein
MGISAADYRSLQEAIDRNPPRLSVSVVLFLTEAAGPTGTPHGIPSEGRWGRRAAS